MYYRRSLQLMLPAILCLLACGTPARAELVTDAGSIPVSQKVVDFSQFTGGYKYFGLTYNYVPVQIGGNVGEDIRWSATDPFSLIGDSNAIPYDISPNGFWDDGRAGFTALDAVAGTMTYTFRNPVSAVGGFINYSPDPLTSVTITAVDSSGKILESYDITNLAPLSTPGQANAGGFRGIVLSTAVIAAFQVSDSYVVLDDLTFSHTSAVPEPSTLVLCAASGLSGIVMLRRRKQGAKTSAPCSRC